MQFEIKLAKADGRSSRRATTLHMMLAFTLCGLGAGSILLYWFTSVSPNFQNAYTPFLGFGICSLLAGAAITAITVFYKNWLLQGKRSLALRSAELLLLIVASVLYHMAAQKVAAIIFGVMAALVLLATIWESRKPPRASAFIDESGIAIPKGNFSKLIKWDEVESVLLRHGILSIELTGNRLIQRVLGDGPYPVEAIEDFSQKQIKLYEKERLSKADW